MIKKIISKIFNKKISPSQSCKDQDHRKKEIEDFHKSINQRLSGIFNDSQRSNPSKSKVRRHSKKRTTQTNQVRRGSQNSLIHIAAEDYERDENNRDRGRLEKHNRRNKSRSNTPHHKRGLPHPKSTSPYQERTSDDSSQTSKASDFASVFNSDAKFSEMNLSPSLSECLTSHNFIHPSKVQEQSIPTAMEKKNLICSSETGSGKTLAFVIPILEKFIRQEIDQACILTPTREIAIQIESVMRPLVESLGVSTGLAIGGMDMLVQRKILREYPKVLIATPGRLVDVSSQGLVWLNYTSVVVLDEVDRMLDMGFEKEISTLFGLFDPKAQILMFTATMNAELEKLSQNYVKEYELITIGETMKTKDNIDHLFVSLPSKERYLTLKSLLKRRSSQKVLVFFNSIDETIKIFRQLKKDNFTKLNCLHSRKSQNERNQVMATFRNDQINHLLTTDVLARGIDIPSIDMVINYELPRDNEDYVHRIGRTGRADFLGKALSFVNKKDQIKLEKIKKLVKSDRGFNFINIKDLKHF